MRHLSLATEMSSPTVDRPNDLPPQFGPPSMIGRFRPDRQCAIDVPPPTTANAVKSEFCLIDN